MDMEGQQCQMDLNGFQTLTFSNFNGEISRVVYKMLQLIETYDFQDQIVNNL